MPRATHVCCRLASTAVAHPHCREVGHTGGLLLAWKDNPCTTTSQQKLYDLFHAGVCAQTMQR